MTHKNIPAALYIRQARNDIIVTPIIALVAPSIGIVKKRWK